jgi:hypothetical protein
LLWDRARCASGRLLDGPAAAWATHLDHAVQVLDDVEVVELRKYVNLFHGLLALPV